ncbi:MAG: transcriptional repressor NrdR [Betaproteobacteria bacterium]|jgi:transcriptional repressor NrdR|nr:transcriptional repressor NrdR [Betaproteobacteria bacterium]
MRCPACASDDTQVTETRVSDDAVEIRRRRRCLACGRRFKTVERIEVSLPTVVKKNGARLEFDEKKLRASLALALRKRPVPAEILDAAVRKIEEQLAASGEREVATQRIGELVMAELRKLDKVAYIRFASVYRSFQDVAEFQELVAEVSPRSAAKRGPKKKK